MDALSGAAAVDCIELDLDRVVRRVVELEAELQANAKALAERRRIEEALRRSEERGRIAAEAARMGLWSWEADGDVMILDKTSAAMLGWAPVVTRTTFPRCLEAIHPGDHPQLEEAARVVAARGVLQDLEVRVVLPGGSTRWLLISGKRAAAGPSEPVTLIGSLFDVTERRSLEEQLRQAQKMEAVGELTAGIAHNFNNLLTAIIPSIQLARRDATGPVSDRLRDAEYAACRAAELVRELMLFARHDRSPSRICLEVGELVQRTVSMCRATFDRAIEVELVVADKLPPVAGDAAQLEQVFLNICLNARDALEASGKTGRNIRIELDRVEEADGVFVRIRISDNGSGMADEVRARIFEPFFTTKEVGRGTGLGLATAYAIASDHGGRLLCDSRPTVGTTFTVLLPASFETVRHSGALPQRNLGGTETVLVIDDERLVRNAVRGILEPMGYTVHEAADGESGLALFQRERDGIDVVLLDVSMPGVRGTTAFANIQSEAPDAKVVLFTEYLPRQAPEGARGILQKPFELEDLLRVVREVCDGPLRQTGQI